MRSQGHLAVALALLVAAQARAAGDLILSGGTVYTMDARRPWATAVVIRDGRIVYVGDEAGAKAFQKPGTRVIGAEGRMVLPAFHDSHTHPMSSGMRLLRCRLQGLESAEAIAAAVRKCAAALRPSEWLIGSGLSLAAFGREGPSRLALDRLVPDRPVYLGTEDGFTAWVNSKALAISGIDPEASAPELEGLRRDRADGKPAGTVSGTANERVRRHLPTPSGAQYREALRLTTAMANRFGIASVVDAAVTPAMLEAYRAADAASELTVRVVCAQRVDRGKGGDPTAAMVAARDRARGRHLRADAAKLFLDGEIDLHTAAMLAPYGGSDRGELLMSAEVVDALVRRLDQEGFLIHMHAMGDRAVRVGLDAIRDAARANGTRDRRHQLAHLGVVSPDDLARFAALGVAADFQPLWFRADDPANAAIAAALGPARASAMYPIGSIAAAGGRIVASSDWPSTPMNPLEAIQAAITRQPLDGGAPPLQPRQRMGLAAMLSAYTKDAAWLAREDAVDGSIEVGKAADLVVLERNLFEVEVSRLHAVRVLLTLLEGRAVYRDPAISWPEGPD